MIFFPSLPLLLFQLLELSDSVQFFLLLFLLKQLLPLIILNTLVDGFLILILLLLHQLFSFVLHRLGHRQSMLQLGLLLLQLQFLNLPSGIRPRLLLLSAASLVLLLLDHFISLHLLHDLQLQLLISFYHQFLEDQEIIDDEQLLKVLPMLL